MGAGFWPRDVRRVAILYSASFFMALPNRSWTIATARSSGLERWIDHKMQRHFCLPYNPSAREHDEHTEHGST